MNYQKQFIYLAIKWFPHHTLLNTAVRFNVKSAIKILNKFATRHIIDISDVIQFSDDDLARYTQSFTNVKFWHGTGRYQYSSNGIANVFNKILSESGLLPTTDIYAIFNDGKPIESISLTKLRVIARSYADTHAYTKPLHRYGSALVWSAYYYNTFYARAMVLRAPKYYRSYTQWKKHAYDKNGHVTWGKKVNTNSQTVWDVFGLGSDITGNYPILFGVNNVQSQVILDKPFAKYEVRTTCKIPLSAITHIEVPLRHVDTTTKHLEKLVSHIKVFPIELGEYYDSQRQFSQILAK